MPEFTVKEVHLPELHLPEVKRDDIVRSLSGVRLPDVDLARAKRASARIPAVTVSGSDVGRLLAAAVALARFVRPSPGRTAGLAFPFARRSRRPRIAIIRPQRRRSRWPFAVAGLAILALAAWAVFRRPAVRQRVRTTARDLRARMDDLRDGRGTSALEVLEPVGLTTAEAGIDEPVEDRTGPATETAGAGAPSTPPEETPAAS